MLADDERIIREGISTLIDWESMGISLIAAVQNGIEACSIIAKDPPHIVITDIKMPGMDGLELIEKTSKQFPYINFVILSGYGEFELARKAMQFGVKYYLLKPCNKEEITSILEDIVFSLNRALNRNNPAKMKYSPAVDTAIEFVENNIEDEQLSLKWMANKILYMNVDYLGKIFKKETGENFSQYVVRIRIEKAKQLLKNRPDHRTFEIAAMSGFGDNPQYFSQVFKKYTGSTPSEYRQNL